jgi:hypothetical protein
MMSAPRPVRTPAVEDSPSTCPKPRVFQAARNAGVAGRGAGERLGTVLLVEDNQGVLEIVTGEARGIPIGTAKRAMRR